jgi:glycolate oxidase
MESRPVATGPTSTGLSSTGLPGPGLPGPGLAAELAGICGDANVISDPQQLRTYECDGLTAHRSTPGLVVLPQSATQVAAIVAACATRGVAFVARGSGTGLSGGALPVPTAY